MDDFISRQAAIDAIRNATFSFTIKSDIDFANYRKEIQEILNNVFDAQEKALNQLPSAQPEKRTIKRTETHSCDYISRQAAIDAMSVINDSICQQQAIDALCGLPSAQPEIIRCKDCKWKQGSECVRFAEVRPFPDDFCSRGEKENR